MIDKKRLIKLTQEVLQINSENPPGNELALSKFIEKDMRSLGLSVKTYTFAKARPNVVAILKGKNRKLAAKRSILITPHFDTVPAGKGWKFGPFSGQIKNGRIYGRGASDDKGNLACAMEAMRSLVEDKVSFNYDIIFAATVDEETGSKKGIIPLIEKGIIKPEVALVLDSDEFYSIVAQKGLMHMLIQVFGKKAHGAYNWRGINAIEIASKIIQDLKALEFRYKKHEFLRPPTINIGTIQGGDKVNMVADFCEFSCDFRFLPGMKHQEILKDVKSIVSHHAKRSKMIIDDLQMPYEIDPNHDLVKLYSQSCKKMKRPAILKGSEGATVITFFQKKKIPAIATGYGSTKTAHSTDEYAEVKKLYDGARVLEQFLKDFDTR
ncbi:MAG: M20 family metallopeptidase [Candidatus Omnitrophica bacterium]|nr:M20 family metallopeptidase [Candidatus Omnitrophota bacterium]